ncbi:MAG TPA: hypothetical protein VK942_08235, partial [Actinomycetes bacterium]|nr:hypothetical protein [Actinomycetes bacterium]
MRGGLADPGDLIQPVDRVGGRGDQLLELGVELGEVGIQRVHPAQQLAQQEGVLVGEAPGERLLQQRQLGALSVDAGVVEASAQVLEPCGRVGQRVPDDDQDGAADRHDGPL